MPDRQPLVAIITGLPLEYEAVRSLLTGLRERMIGTALSVEVGELPDSAWQVALADASSAHIPATILIKDVVRQLRPDALLFVGIAGGLKDTVEVGDLVIATRIYAFQGGEQTPEGFYARPQSWDSSHRMEQTARSALRDLTGVHFGAVTASDVVLNHEHSSLLDQLKRSYNDALAVEMEGAGVAHVAHLTTGLEMLTVRGISDVADPAKKPGDPRAAQSHAANRAAGAAAAVLRKLPPLPSHSTSLADSGDHIDFRGSTFFGTNVGKIAVESPREDN
ncbi:5'-methylthioadenosine/S-adenosylhomocysteine nucleosidase [Streptomyces acidiscabies]|uniref:5'-methylthioadenosine/S-adenosylhomocysteine nucleosidase n=1 Tax=Streptomyces acidiscabies TaxID=42234 RepID=UPI000967C30F|nr:5'-methylthioadenosine/S-adenosylhomocysteine nucleosidase [Streptomyces acidiscabies]GAV43380.1 5'-methylthioadenosine/S-adenosylhomocysteine [Streptomyces acidiscabies]